MKLLPNHDARSQKLEEKRRGNAKPERRSDSPSFLTPALHPRPPLFWRPFQVMSARQSFTSVPSTVLQPPAPAMLTVEVYNHQSIFTHAAETSFSMSRWRQVEIVEGKAIHLQKQGHTRTPPINSTCFRISSKAVWGMAAHMFESPQIIFGNP